MQLERFVAARQPLWGELSALIARSGGRADRLAVTDVARLGRLYREAVADLALARRAAPREAVTAQLERLVAEAHPLVYATPSRGDTLGHLVRRRYWQEVRAQPVALGVAAGLLFVPAAAIAVWAHARPERALALVPAEMAGAARPRDDTGGLGLSTPEQAAFSSAIFTNNIRVAFFAFAGGATAGLMTGAVLVVNGLLLGLLAGLSVAVGSGGRFVELVAPHGVLELSLIVVAGAAGLRLGWAIVDPGFRSRRQAMVTEGKASVVLVLGTGVWLVVAGLVEGFVTPRGAGTSGALVIGCVVAAVYWSLVAVLGRPDPPLRLHAGEGLLAQVGGDTGRGETVGLGDDDRRAGPA